MLTASTVYQQCRNNEQDEMLVIEEHCIARMGRDDRIFLFEDDSYAHMSEDYRFVRFYSGVGGKLLHTIYLG